jgi:hypothetical protein
VYFRSIRFGVYDAPYTVTKLSGVFVAFFVALSSRRPQTTIECAIE